MQKAQTFYDSVVEIDQFRFRQLVDVDSHHGPPSQSAFRAFNDTRAAITQMAGQHTKSTSAIAMKGK
jgi:hypothetical protein